MNSRKLKMFVSILLGSILAIGLLFWLGSRIGVGKSRLAITQEGTHFPVVSGYNLMRVEYEFPQDFEGSYNLLFIPFQQWQQRQVNTWIPAAQELEREKQGLIYYEFPTIYELPGFSRTFINEGMRAGIPDQTARERTITLYLDKESFKDALAIKDEETITVLLVNSDGEILWREKGEFSAAKLDDLRGILNDLE